MKKTVFTESGPELVDDDEPVEGRPNFTQMELGVCFAFGFAMGGGFGFGLCYLLFFI